MVQTSERTHPYILFSPVGPCSEAAAETKDYNKKENVEK